MLSTILLYFHTLRHLKPSQIYWRIRYKFVRFEAISLPQPELRVSNGQWVIPAKRRDSMTTSGTFKFLNKTELLEQVGWDGKDCEKLWRYNQHYFDDLNALNARKRYKLHRELILDWIGKNKPGKGTGWEPYPTSLRIVNWIKWCLAGNKLSNKSLQSLATQAQWLTKNIEWHILGNHLFANAKALVFCGLFFKGKEAQKWLMTGLDIIVNELPEQVLPDGGHFELSPMYHSIFLEDVLDLINILGLYRNVVSKTYIEKFYDVVKRMLDWLEGMLHPDGEIAFFNDSAVGIAPSPEEIKSYAYRLDICLNHSYENKQNPSFEHYVESGYIRLIVPNTVLILDVAAIGPDYLPGHGHADILSFEMSFFGKRVFVNNGTSQYGTGKARLIERGTAAHNTMVINDENSSEIWSTFRVAKRANPFGLIIDKTDTSLSVSCCHDGYKRLSGKPIHQRSWMLNDGKLLIKDRVDGVFTTAKSLFHLHPEIIISPNGKYKWTLCSPGSKKFINFTVLKGLANIEPSVFLPEFGIRIPTQCLSIQFDNSKEIIVEMTWSTND